MPGWAEKAACRYINQSRSDRPTAPTPLRFNNRKCEPSVVAEADGLIAVRMIPLYAGATYPNRALAGSEPLDSPSPSPGYQPHAG